MGTPQRSRFVPEPGQAVVLAAVLWSVAAWDYATRGRLDRIGQLKGTDFVRYYTLGTAARLGRYDILYDFEQLVALQQAVVPEAADRYLPVDGPQMALVFAPLSALPYGAALAVWNAISAALIALSAWILMTRLPALARHRTMVALLVIGSPGFFNLLLHGQNTAPAVLLLTLAGLAYVARREFLCGLAIGCLIYKPQLGVTAGVVFCATGMWRGVAGALVGSAIQIGLTWLTVGSSVLVRYAETLAGLGAQSDALMPKPYQMHNLRAFFALWLPPDAAIWLSTASAIVLWGCLVWVWRRMPDRRWRWSLLCVATVLTAFHLHVYDLVLLLPAFLWAAAWVATHRDAALAPGLRGWMYASYLLPFASSVARVIPIQWSVIAMVGWVITMIRIAAAETGPDLTRGRADA